MITFVPPLNENKKTTFLGVKFLKNNVFLTLMTHFSKENFRNNKFIYFVNEQNNNIGVSGSLSREWPVLYAF